MNRLQRVCLFGGGCAWSLLRSGMAMTMLSMCDRMSLPLFGVAWQTKMERKRRGTKFVVPHVGFSGLDYREGGPLMPREDLNRDYRMADFNTRKEFNQYPATYIFQCPGSSGGLGMQSTVFIKVQSRGSRSSQSTPTSSRRTQLA